MFIALVAFILEGCKHMLNRLKR